MSEMVERREILFRSITNCKSEALGLGLECYNVYVRRTDGASNTLRSSSDDDDADSLEMERKKAEGRGWWWRLFEAREGDQFKESSTDKTEKRKNEKRNASPFGASSGPSSSSSCITAGRSVLMSRGRKGVTSTSAAAAASQPPKEEEEEEEEEEE